MYIYIVIVICYFYCYLLFYLVLSFHPIPSRNLEEVLTLTIYGSNVPSQPPSCKGIRGLNESRSFIYAQLYKITSKYYLSRHLKVRTWIEPASYCSCIRRLSQLSNTGNTLRGNAIECSKVQFVK